MPISTSGKPYYTQTQLVEARGYSALEYARSVGYDLVAESPTRYHLREHDSMIFLGDGRWYWNSRHRSGRALDFMLAYEGRSLLDAVLALTEGMIQSPDKFEKASTITPLSSKIEFLLPERAPSCEWRRLFAYLVGARKLDQHILQTLVKEKRLYLSKEQRNGGKTVYNAVFVGFDPDGNPASASKRGILSGISYKAEVSGSDKHWPFAIPAQQDNADTLYLFESAIDSISHATLMKLDGVPWRDDHRLATGGNFNPDAVIGYLDAHPRIRRLGTGFDNDEAGQRLVAYTVRVLSERDLVFLDSRPPAYKDWNQYLVEKLR